MSALRKINGSIGINLHFLNMQVQSKSQRKSKHSLRIIGCVISQRAKNKAHFLRRHQEEANEKQRTHPKWCLSKHTFAVHTESKTIRGHCGRSLIKLLQFLPLEIEFVQTSCSRVCHAYFSLSQPSSRWNFLFNHTKCKPTPCIHSVWLETIKSAAETRGKFAFLISQKMTSSHREFSQVSPVNKLESITTNCQEAYQVDNHSFHSVSFENHSRKVRK